MPVVACMCLGVRACVSVCVCCCTRHPFCLESNLPPVPPFHGDVVAQVVGEGVTVSGDELVQSTHLVSSLPHCPCVFPHQLKAGVDVASWENDVADDVDDF